MTFHFPGEVTKPYLDGTESGELNLYTGGRKLHFSVEKEKRQEKVITHKFLDKIQSQTNLSDRKMKQVAQLSRAEHGRKSIEPNYSSHLKEKNHKFDIHIMSEMMLFEKKEGRKVEKILYPFIFVGDVPALILQVKSERNHAGNTLIKIGLDSGKSFLKVTMSVVDLDKLNEKRDGFAETSVKKNVSY